MAILNYVSQTATSISVTYADMPASARVTFINETSGGQTPSQNNTLAAGGSGTAEIAIPGLPGGKYYLAAQSDGKTVAQTVAFYLS